MKNMMLTVLMLIASFTAMAEDNLDTAAEVYFISPQDGATVTNPIRIVFGLRGMGVAPAGVDRPGTGHHHLIINSDLPALDQPIPADENHVHFGGGQTETT
ncbi:MAG: DUF4399 domain-containing protein, partial [Gammaproteobacteria bacterium]|nr:DUF4399 domain-containing protein [Gammaproteobacteria bacterium]